ncbi:MAG: hypothetical protein WD336_09600 [Trueperaceae bacterium]
MHRPNKTTLAALTRIFALAALLASGAALAQGFEREITVTVGDFYFQVEGQEQNAPIVLDAVVPYRITFVNEGSMMHRVKMGRGVMVEEGVPYAYHENLFSNVPLRVFGTDASGADFRIDTTFLTQLDLEPGATLELAFTLPSDARGEWEIGCFIPGHYENGHVASLTVQ